MVAYAKPQQKKKEESERLRGEERDQIKFVDLRFERWQVVGLRKPRRSRYYQSCSGWSLLSNTIHLNICQCWVS